MSPPTEPLATWELSSEPDDGKALMVGLVRELRRRIETPEIAKDMSAAEFELIRKLLSDNSISLASIRRGDFGQVAQKAAEEFPFPAGNQVQGTA